jgi:hypothetical protein
MSQPAVLRMELSVVDTKECDILNFMIEVGEEIREPPCNHVGVEKTVMQHLCQICFNPNVRAKMKRNPYGGGLACIVCGDTSGNPILAVFFETIR